MFSYQWISNDGTTDADIQGETDATYTLVAAYVGNTIKVKVTFTDDADNEETLTSAATAKSSRWRAHRSAWESTQVDGHRQF